MNRKELIDHAFQAMKNSYAPYSQFHVGAAVACRDGKVFYGANIENASYGATNCAERSAMFSAYSNGVRKEDIEAIAIVADGETIATHGGTAGHGYTGIYVQWKGKSGSYGQRSVAVCLYTGGPAMRSGFVALAGRPNAGKSTLINSLVGEKVAIVSDKPQTTRSEIRGIYTDEDVQIVFTDIPGIHKQTGNKNEPGSI